MKDDSRESRRRLKSQKPVSYEVGYARPPKATQFRKGQSGNPVGRPKGAKSKLPHLNEERLKDIIIAEAYRTIKVREGERNVTLSMAEAVVRSISVSAAKGQHRSQRLFTQLLRTTETENKRLANEWLQTAIEYKVEWEKEIARCERLGLPVPEPLPHPKDIEIDMKTGQVLVKGPFTPEQKERWDFLRQRKKESLMEIQEIQNMLADPENAHIRRQLEEDLEREKKLYEKISTVIKD